MTEITGIYELGSHTTYFNIRGLADMKAGLAAGINADMTFQPDHVEMKFTWDTRRVGNQGPRGWHVYGVVVSGFRRLRDDSLGKERKRQNFYSDWETTAPPDLAQLIRAYMPSYPVGVSLNGQLTALLDLAELGAHRD